MIRILSIFFLLIISDDGFSQPMDSIFFKDGTKTNREKFYQNAVTHSIAANLTLPLSDETEEDWQAAFDAMATLQYRSPFVQGKIEEAVLHIYERSDLFKRKLIEVLYTLFPENYYPQIKHVFASAKDPKLLAVSANYLLKYGDKSELPQMRKKISSMIATDPNPVLEQLDYQLSQAGKEKQYPSIKSLFDTNYLSGKVLVISVQRENRDFPGIVMVRRPHNGFVKNSDSSIFFVNQLARSASNMPSYISNGNTPQGIFRMFGFARSRSYFIGPTPNLQLAMPFEYSAKLFFADSTRNDSNWNFIDYKKLLPAPLQNYYPLYGTYYAGKAGRNEIIAHGTTIDPNYYTNTTYFPFTPTAGCLATEEWWDEETGKLKKSGQWQLANAVRSCSNGDGYFVVVNINDKQQPVTIDEVLELL